MKPLHLNLAVLAFFTIIASFALLVFGRGVVVDSIIGVIGLGWFAQFAVLKWSRLRELGAPRFASKQTFVLWTAALYPLMIAGRPEFPAWFVWASIPAGYLLAYVAITMLDGILLLQLRFKRWVRLRFNGQESIKS